MSTDYETYAKQLKIINVFEPRNSSGVVTDKRLYDKTVPDSHAPGIPSGPNWPADHKGRGGVKHATVGTNSLRYLAGGSIADGRWVCAHYLIPKDNFTVYKLVPDGYGCNHAYPAAWKGYVNNLNSNFYGVEVENLQDGADPFTDSQYIKFAFVWAYLAARDHIPNLMLVDHGIAAPGHRTDPYEGGMWDDAAFYGHMWAIRQTPAVWEFWHLPMYDGR